MYDWFWYVCRPANHPALSVEIHAYRRTDTFMQAWLKIHALTSIMIIFMGAWIYIH